MGTIKKLFEKYKSIILYGFFGVLTTVINIASYFVCYNILKIPNVISTIVAWVLGVVFAFVTNKLFVFDSKSFEKNIILHEIITFFGCRVLTGVLDVGIMWIAVDIMNWNSILWKVISNILVIIANYIASKLVIFKKR